MVCLKDEDGGYPVCRRFNAGMKPGAVCKCISENPVSLRFLY